LDPTNLECRWCFTVSGDFLYLSYTATVMCMQCAKTMAGKVVLQFCQNGERDVMLSPEIVIREIRQVVIAHSVVLMRI